MKWKEFIEDQAGRHGLSGEQTETLLEALPFSDKAPATQEEIRAKLNIGIPAVKGRMKDIYKIFEMSFPLLIDKKSAGKLKFLHTELKKKYYQPPQPVTEEQPSNLFPYPEQFRSLIEEQNRTFCGRRFVFEAFEKFISTNAKGYFILEGYAGIGKTSLAAKYIYDNLGVICYFFLEGNENKPEQFLSCIRQQLINRYNLDNSEEDNLPSLLSKVKNNPKFSKPLVIVVDNLDEVNQYTAGGKNILYLPKNLPDGVYFFLTRQPSNLRTDTDYYNLNKDCLSTGSGTEVYKFNLNSQDYMEFNYKDVTQYISYVNEQDNQLNRKINCWINSHNLTREAIIDMIAKKSENNFRCLNYLIKAIVNEFYEQPIFNKLSPDLSSYYQTHWLDMGMQNHKDESRRQILLYILVYKGGCQIPIDQLHVIAGEEESYIEDVLKDWLKYLKHKTISDKHYYTICNANFIEYIQSQHIMKSNRAIFKIVNHKINEYLNLI
ncbi:MULTISPECIES: hypothetical protein [unclassified Microcoleus]|uniref:hypothetical protein n=1 Tax=unclassified Microcoleus TaxID=2642155 RepID=UPI002FCE78A0